MNETLSFIRENTKKGLSIPPTALMMSGIENQPLEYRTLPSAIVAFRRSMTAMELIDTIHSLNRCALELFDGLVDILGKCDGCDEQCNLTEENNFGYVFLPDELREQAGIPAGAKVTVMPDQDTGTVTVMQADYEHDLSDVPSVLMQLLKYRGVCLETLECLLMDEDIVYGE
ncbi:MAG: hypothetical protein J5449_11415 [Oscillospiraceae bacterium]|nr:hypothetical protein [Oscillospiraceae bacterium]